jgi:hypothetical protein
LMAMCAISPGSVSAPQPRDAGMMRPSSAA